MGDRSGGPRNWTGVVLLGSAMALGGCGLVNALQDPAEDEGAECAADECPAPQGLEAEGGVNSVTLSWDPLDGVVGYEVAFDGQTVELGSEETAFELSDLEAPEVPAVEMAEFTVEIGGGGAAEVVVSWGYPEVEFEGEAIEFEVRGLFGEGERGEAEKVEGSTRDEVAYFELESQMGSHEVGVGERDSEGWVSYEGGRFVDGGSGSSNESEGLVLLAPVVVSGEGVKVARFDHAVLPDLVIDLTQRVRITAVTASERRGLLIEEETAIEGYSLDMVFEVSSGEDEGDDTTEVPGSGFLEVAFDGETGEVIWEDVEPLEVPVGEVWEPFYGRLAELVGIVEDGEASFDWRQLRQKEPALLVAGNSGKEQRYPNGEHAWSGEREEGTEMDTIKVLADGQGWSYWLERFEYEQAIGVDYQGGNRIAVRDGEGAPVWTGSLGEGDEETLVDMTVDGEGVIYALGADDLNEDSPGQSWRIYRVEIDEEGQAEVESGTVEGGELNYADWMDEEICAPDFVEVDDQGRLFALCGERNRHNSIFVEFNEQLEVVQSQWLVLNNSWVSPGMVYDGQGHLVMVREAIDGGSELIRIDIQDGRFPEDDDSYAWQLLEAEGNEWGIEEVADFAIGGEDLVYVAVTQEKTLMGGSPEIRPAILVVNDGSVGTFDEGTISGQSADAMAVSLEGVVYLSMGGTVNILDPNSSGAALGSTTIGVDEVKAMATTPGAYGQFRSLWEDPPQR